MDWGQVFRGFVPTAMQLDQQKQQQANWDKSFGLQQAAEGRAATQFGWQEAEQERKQSQQKRQDSIMDAARQMEDFRSRLADPRTDIADLATGMTEFWNTHPEMKNGQHARVTELNGQPVLVNGSLSRNDVQIAPLTRETLAGAMRMGDEQLRRQIALAGGPEAFDRYVTGERSYGLESRKVGATETTASAAKQQANTSEAFKELQGKLIEEQIRTGNWGQVGLNSAHAGYFNHMPRGGQNAGGANLTEEQAAVLNKAMAFQEQARQLAKAHPEAANAYRTAAVQAVETLPAKVQLAVGGLMNKEKPAGPMMSWDAFMKTPAFTGDPTKDVVTYAMYNKLLDPSSADNMAERKQQPQEQRGVGQRGFTDPIPENSPYARAVSKLQPGHTLGLVGLMREAAR